MTVASSVCTELAVLQRIQHVMPDSLVIQRFIVELLFAVVWECMHGLLTSAAVVLQICESLVELDRLFAEFELRLVLRLFCTCFYTLVNVEI